MDVHSSIQAMASHLNTQEGPLECGLASGRVRVRSHLWDDDIVIDRMYQYFGTGRLTLSWPKRHCVGGKKEDSRQDR